jgi:hypothetical protein
VSDIPNLKTLYAPHIDKRDSVMRGTVRVRGGSSDIGIISVSVTRDRVREVRLGCHEEGGDYVPVTGRGGEPGPAENFRQQCRPLG